MIARRRSETPAPVGNERSSAAGEQPLEPATAVVEHLASPMAVLALDGRFLHVNDAYADRVGRTRDELADLRVRDILHGDDVDLDGLLSEQLRLGHIARYRLPRRYLRKDGEVVAALVQVSLVRSRQGEPAYFVAELDEVTASPTETDEREELLTRLEAERKWLDTVVAQSPAGIFLLEGTSPPRVRMNMRAAEIFGPQGGVLPGTQILDPDGVPIPIEQSAGARALRGEVIRSQEYVVRRPDGSTTAIVGSAAPIRDATGTIIGGVGVFEDVSALKEHERRLREWTTLVAHELQQPANIIRIYAELLATRIGAAPELTSIVAASDRLDRMVDDLLDGDAVDTKRLTVRLEPLDVGPLVETWVREFFAGSEVRVRTDVAPDLPPVSADAARIEQVLDNLLSNAHKYGDPARDIVVTVRADRGDVWVSVENYGVGITEQELPHVFDRFRRTAASMATNRPGLGLGLYIVKGVVEAHGGRVTVESTPERRTTFRFSLKALRGDP